MTASRVRFASHQSVIHNDNATISVGLDDLMRMPLPPRFLDEAYAMDMCTAASIGNAEEVMKCLSRTQSNFSNRAGWTALLYAAQLDHKDICDLLIKSGADVNLANAKGQTPLMLAAACGNKETSRLLIGKGADVQARDRKGRTALHAAASCSQHEIVSQLLTHGGDPNSPDNEAMTPTLEACSAAHEHTLKALLDKGGNTRLRNLAGEDGVALAGDSRAILDLIDTAPRTLSQLLARMSLEKYEEKFRKESVDSLDVFFRLDDADLTEMGIPYGPKRRMLAVISQFRRTGEVKIDAVELPTAVTATAVRGDVRSASPSSHRDQQSETAATLRLIAQNCEKGKQHALAAFEHSGDPARLAELLPQIINCFDTMAARLARHSNA